MEYAFGFVTLGLGGALLLYALLLRLTLDVRMIPRYQAADRKNDRAYAKTLSHILAFLALALLTAGWVGLYAGPMIGLLMLAVCLALAIWLCIRLWKRDRRQ